MHNPADFSIGFAEVEKHCYQFGPFRIDNVERVLYRGTELIPLTPKAADTLLALVSNPGRVVDKDELIKMVWAGTFVEEGVLTRNIFTLRKALDEGDESQYIATIPKRGYRFVAQVTVDSRVDSKKEESKPVPLPAVQNERTWFKRAAWVIPAVMLILIAAYLYVKIFLPPPAADARISSLAVLPFQNLSNDPSQEYFAEGMTEELITTLAKIRALTVKSRTTVEIYRKSPKPLPQIARELNVDNIVVGSVLQSSGRVRITVQLFTGKTEQALWAQSYEQDLRDVLALQADMASSIAREIQITVTPQDKQRLAHNRQVDPDAYLAYANGRFYWNKRTPDAYPRAMAYFQQAINKDGTYAPAYAGLADSLALLGSVGSGALSPTQAMPQAKAAAMKAVSLDDNLAEGHTSLAYVKMSYDWDLDGAEREFKRAIELDPNYATGHHWYAHYFLAKGQPEKAIVEIKHAQTLDPLSFSIYVGVGWCYYHARRYDEAVEKYRKSIELNPEFPLTRCTLGMALVQKQQYEEALAEFKKAKDLGGSPAFANANIAAAYALSGRTAEARRLLADLLQSAQRQYVPAVYMGAIYTTLGDKQHALDWLEKGYQERSDYMVYLKTEPWGDTLRSEPRFQKLLARIASGRN